MSDVISSVKLTDKKKVGYLTFLCTIAYFVSYISRINLSAVMVEAVSSGFSPKQTAALALTVCSVTYGGGQVISGWLGDRFKPQNVMFSGFLLTAAMNIAVFLIKDSSYLVAFWAVNGFAQALMWPPIVAILTSYLSSDDYKKACVKISWGSAFGTIAVYLLAPLVIISLSFKYVFLISGIAALFMAFYWKISFRAGYEQSDVVYSNENIRHKEISSQKFDRQAVLMIIPIAFSIIMQGSLRDGIANWMPTYISETFRLDSSVSILTGVVLPIFHILCVQLASIIYRKWIRNAQSCAAFFFILCSISAFVLALSGGGSGVIWAIALMAITNGCTHGINTMQTCMTPPGFAKYGHVSLVSGILNSCTYIGAAVSTYGISLFSDMFGWNSTIYLWSAIALAGAVLCILISKKWDKFTK